METITQIGSRFKVEPTEIKKVRPTLRGHRHDVLTAFAWFATLSLAVY